MMSSEKILLFVGTYTRSLSHAKAISSKGIYTYNLDPATGELTFLNVTEGIDDPSYLAIDHSKHFLYATSEVLGWEEGLCSAYVINHSTGSLTYINKQPTLGSNSAHLSIDSSSHYVLLANYSTGKTVVMFPIRADGGIAPACAAVEHQGTGPITTRQDRSHGHCVLPDPTNKYIFVADLGTDQIVSYVLDMAAGKLLPHTTFKLAPGSGPRHFLFHPNGHWAYVIQELNSTILALAYDSEQGKFEAFQSVSTLPEAYEGENYCAAIQVTPDGKFLYGSNRGHNTIAIYSINTEAGELTLIGHQSTLGNTPRDFAIDPTGTFLLVANQDSDTIVTFRINHANGMLIETSHVAQVATPVCLKMISV